MIKSKSIPSGSGSRIESAVIITLFLIQFVIKKHRPVTLVFSLDHYGSWKMVGSVRENIPLDWIVCVWVGSDAGERAGCSVWFSALRKRRCTVYGQLGSLALTQWFQQGLFAEWQKSAAIRESELRVRVDGGWYGAREKLQLCYAQLV